VRANMLILSAAPTSDFFSRREASEDEVVPFCTGFMAGEAYVMLRFVDWLAADESTETPSTRCRISLGIFHHHLNRRSRSRNKGSVDSR
jgi:hypothetical protein